MSRQRQKNQQVNAPVAQEDTQFESPTDMITAEWVSPDTAIDMQTMYGNAMVAGISAPDSSVAGPAAEEESAEQETGVDGDAQGTGGQATAAPSDGGADGEGGDGADDAAAAAALDAAAVVQGHRGVPVVPDRPRARWRPRRSRERTPRA